MNSSSSDERLYDLIESLTDRIAHATPDEVGEILREAPELAPHLENLLPVMQVLAGMKADESGRGNLLTEHRLAKSPTLTSMQESEMGSDHVHDYLKRSGLQVVREMGRGGMGVVYEALEVALSRRVAVKVLPPHLLDDKSRKNRFRHEAFAAARLQHANIVDIYSVHCDEMLHYYVMRYVSGCDLSRLLREEGLPGETQSDGSLRRMISAWGNGRRHGTITDGVPVSKSADIPASQARKESSVHRTTQARARFVAHLGRQAAEALDYAHSAGVVHRDIKPANLLIENNGHLWITDFGLAQVEQLTGLTQTGDVIGTLRYMSPEQLSGERQSVDHRTDIYSLGITLIEALLGNETCQSKPEHSHGQERWNRETALSHRGLRRLMPGLPIDLETILFHCINASPADRYPNARLLAMDLQAFLEHRPIQAKPPTWIDHSAKWVRRHQRTAIAVVATLLLAVAVFSVGLILLMRERQARYFEQLLAEKQTEVLKANQEVLRNHQYVVEIQLAHAAWERLEPEVARQHLDRCIPAFGEHDLRGFEWFYMNSLLNSSPPPIGRHRGEAYYIQFSRDGRWMATCGSDGTKIFETSTWRELIHLTGHTADVNSCQFSSDGGRLVTSGDDGQVCIWSTADWRVECQLSFSRLVVFAFLTDDAKALIVCQRDRTSRAEHSNTVARIDLSTRETVWETTVDNGSLHAAAYVAEEDQLAVSTDIGQLSVLRCSDGEIANRTVGVGLLSIAAMPDASQLAVGDGDGKVHFFSTDSQEVPSYQVVCAENSIESLDYHPAERRLVHASRDGTVGVWNVDLESRGEILTLQRRYRHHVPLWCARLDPAGKHLVTTDRKGSVIRWDLAEPNIQIPQQHSVNDPTQMTLKELAQFASGSQRFDISGDGHFVAGVLDNQPLRIWDMQVGQLVHVLDAALLAKYYPELEDTQNAPFSACFIPQTHILSVAVGENTVFVDAHSGLPSEHFAYRRISSRQAKWHPSGLIHYEINGPENQLRAWDVQREQRWTGFGVGHAEGHWSPDGQFLLLHNFRNYASVFALPESLAETTRWPQIATFAAVGSLAYSADGKTIAEVLDGRISLYSATTQRKVLEWSTPEFPRYGKPRFSPDGRRFTVEGTTNTPGALVQYVWSLDGE